MMIYEWTVMMIYEWTVMMIYELTGITDILK